MPRLHEERAAEASANAAIYNQVANDGPKQVAIVSTNSNIEWTDATWNPVTGCTKVSPGCAHCYIERTPPFRIGHRKFDEKGTTGVICHEDRLYQPLKWRQPKRVFVNSLSDLFHEEIRDTFIADIFGVMARCPQHIFQILTKRPTRMLEWMKNGAGWMTLATDFQKAAIPGMLMPWPLPNVWLGVSVENQHFADERIPLLLQTPAVVRFISAEPLLEGITLSRLHEHCPTHDRSGGFCTGDCPDRRRLDWVIIGGESGPGARPFDLAWAYSLRAQCKAAGVACFIKQLGSVPVEAEEIWHCRDWNGRDGIRLLNARNRFRAPAGCVPLKFQDNKGGNPEEWPEDLRVREFPQ
jgi:protein gp37